MGNRMTRGMAAEVLMGFVLVLGMGVEARGETWGSRG